jgi:LacI family transcriptional regulator
MKKKVNIRSVAEAAGVSVATVSGILNHSDRHSPATAAKIRQVMQEMGYVPRRNRLRRKPEAVKEIIQRVGVLFPDTNDLGTKTPLGKNLIAGIRESLAEQNIQIDVFTLEKDGSLPESITRHRLDGLIIRSGFKFRHGDIDLFRALKESGIPMVWTFGSASLSEGVDFVRMDDRGCGLLAADKVDVTNHGRIFVIKPVGEPNLDLEIRSTAFMVHLRTLNIQEDPVVLETDSAHLALKNLRSKTPVTIFVPGHDADIFSVHKEIYSHLSSKGIPTRLIAVMTDEVRLSKSAKQDIHTFHIDPFRIGLAAGRQLLWRHQMPWMDHVKLMISVKELSSSKSTAKKRPSAKRSQKAAKA